MSEAILQRGYQPTLSYDDLIFSCNCENVFLHSMAWLQCHPQFWLEVDSKQ